MAVGTLSLDGKVAVVTGSGRENGIATALSRNGAAVVLNYVSVSVTQRANELAKKLRAEGGRVAVVQASVDSPEGAKHLVDETLKAFETSHIDILVNNAGAGFVGETVSAKPEEINKIFDVNVKVPVYMAQAVIPHMPSGGRVINVSSMSSRLGEGHLPIYGASKAALDSLTFSWSKEWGRSRGITVNAVAPGPVNTDIIPPGMSDLILGTQKATTRAADRIGTVEDIADAVLLLASEKSRWITGQYISASGGVTGL